jgi:hypothetical protein
LSPPSTASGSITTIVADTIFAFERNSNANVISDPSSILSSHESDDDDDDDVYDGNDGAGGTMSRIARKCEWDEWHFHLPGYQTFNFASFADLRWTA